MSLKSMIAITSIVAAGALGGFGISSAVAASVAGTHSNQGGVQVTHPYSKNARGETYGSSAFAKSPSELPDLIAAFGEDHKTRGFVRKTDLESRAQPKSPAEVAARVASGQTGRVGDKEVPLYAQDGVTVVGSFIVKGWSVKASEPPQK